MILYMVCSDNYPHAFLSRAEAEEELALRRSDHSMGGGQKLFDGRIVMQDIGILDYDKGYKAGVFDMANILNLEAEKMRVVNS